MSAPSEFGCTDRDELLATLLRFEPTGGALCFTPHGVYELDASADGEDPGWGTS
jgi:hypothetical protein